ncbi:MFS transporter, partial [Streptomyces sp. NPDC001759]
RPVPAPGAHARRPDTRRFATVLAASALSATGAFTGYTYLVKFLGEVGGFSPGALDSLLVAFGVACLAGVPLTGAVPDRRPRSALSTAIATQAVGMLGLYALGDRPLATVLFLTLMGGALGPVFMTTQNAMLWCAPGRTDIALAANSGLYNAGIATGAALGGLVLSLTDVRTTFLTGGLATAAAYGVLLTERLLDGRPASAG